jgi:micrococcal nuclease
MKLLAKTLLAAALLAAAFGVRAQPAPNPAPDKAAYVASAKSQVFHKPDCQWAAKIDLKNLQTFPTREDAIKAGKRPCKVCKP